MTCLLHDYAFSFICYHSSPSVLLDYVWRIQRLHAFVGLVLTGMRLSLLCLLVLLFILQETAFSGALPRTTQMPCLSHCAVLFDRTRKWQSWAWSQNSNEHVVCNDTGHPISTLNNTFCCTGKQNLRHKIWFQRLTYLEAKTSILKLLARSYWLWPF